MSITSDIKEGLILRDKSMDKSIAWYDRNKNDIHLPMSRAVELHMLGIDCRFTRLENEIECVKL